MRTRLVFVRHAEAEGNKIRRFHGWTDSEITEKGHLQAKRVAERLKDTDIDVIYSSSLKRTMQTASYIAEAKGLPVITSAELREINGGDWEDLKWSELEERWPEEYETWENRPYAHRMPNGESMEEFQKRLLDEVMQIIHSNEGKNICIVTHGTAIRAMLCRFRECTLEEMCNIAWCDNTAITVIDYEDGVFHTVTEGDSTHLGNDLGTIVNQDWWEEYMNKVKAREKERMEQGHIKTDRSED
ncbi:MAG TPA: histidine phosphatase family protein [Clostridia bacterium]|nr:histidine phosphatase family protein [Clostridia bacterium]